MKIKAIDMVRKIRDENYLNANDLSIKEKIEATKKLAQSFSKNHGLHINLKVKRANLELTSRSS